MERIAALPFGASRPLYRSHFPWALGNCSSSWLENSHNVVIAHGRPRDSLTYKTKSVGLVIYRSVCKNQLKVDLK
jgi:hypothetical protein